MRKILGLLLLFSLVISCSEDGSPTEQNNTKLPTNITLSTQSIEKGSILTINGNGFLVNENYIVTFSENVIGNITEINTNNLKVEVPQNAVSGNITLTFNNETSIIGNITIEDNDFSTTYIYHENVGKLATLNTQTGELNYIADFIFNGTTVGAIYNSQNNEYISFRNNTDPNFVKVNLSTGNVDYQVATSTLLTGNDTFSGLTIDPNGVVYIYHENVGKLATLNTQTGELNYIADFISNGTTVSAIYSSQNNEYISFRNNTDPNFVKVNLSTGNVDYQVATSTLLTGNDTFSGLTIDPNGVVYIYHENVGKLATLNTQTGELNYIADFISNGTTVGAIYNSQNNEYISFRNNTDPNFVKVNLSTSNVDYQVATSTLLTGNDTFSGLVVNNEN
ncbi:hypothetical protein FIA58_018775 [Flavobacterium jejuense]|uniref:IPT/TIG domain-containing protein n=1 Tax=Flavobacterium jejuense TaxID=1544455 RepID=A0ABX0J0I1_9FLAO|nr:IPT/TIG domain-containing protein [Flavobacterium jejuense]NHN27731.1 hypothetical protein [Flavobacterium jejuense]